MDTYLMNTRKIGILWFLILCLLAGCAQESEQPLITATQEIAEQATGTPTKPVASVTPAPTDTAVALPTVTQEPTPITPAIIVDSQTLTEDGVITIESVNSVDPGWLVVFADDEDIPGPVLGYETIPSGESKSVSVTIDPYSATSTLHARLHIDAGNSGEFEYPGSDMPVEVGSGEVMESFTVDLELPVPAIDVADQIVAPDGVVRIDEVFALGPSWLVIHTLDAGVVGQAIGQTTVEEGQNRDLEFPIRWRDATAELAAVLYEDKERPGGFNTATDLPVSSEGTPVTAQFEVQLPPDIFVYDQPIIDGKLILERVISEQPGWLVVYNVNDGFPDRIIGFEKVAKGINYLLEVEVVETAVTPQLFLVLHEETNDPAEFNFPTADPAATYNGETIPPTIVHTNPGNYLVTQDQTLGEENEVIIPLVVADLDTWLVIYTQTADGQPDEIIGQAWLPAGVNRNIRIAIPAGMEGENLLAMPHQDGENPREFDYPEGDDVPLQRNRQLVFSPFLLEAYSESASFNP